MLAMKDQEIETTHTELSNILETNRDSVSADVILDPSENVAATFGEWSGKKVLNIFQVVIVKKPTCSKKQ